MSELPTAGQHLQRAADFMTSHDIEAAFISGDLENGDTYEGISFMTPHSEVGEVTFSNGKVIPAERSEIERRLSIQGFVTEVVRPVQRAAAAIYAEGSDLLDERFDTLLGAE